MIKKWKKIKERPYKTNYRKLIRATFRLPDGRLADFDLTGGNKIVSIFAMTIDSKIIMVRQFRPGPEKTSLEFPAGGVNQDESPLKAAKREFLEETGYVGKLKFISKLPNSAYSKSFRYGFIAKECIKIAEPKPDPNEFLETVLLSIKDFKRLLQTNNFFEIPTTALGYLALDYLKLL